MSTSFNTFTEYLLCATLAGHGSVGATSWPLPSWGFRLKIQSVLSPILLGLRRELLRWLPGRRRSDLWEWNIYAKAGGGQAGVEGESPVLVQMPLLL